MSNVDTFVFVEHPDARRLPEQFESKFGAESQVLFAIRRWRNVADEFNRPSNGKTGSPVTSTDLDEAEAEMLAEVRRYGVQSQLSVVTEEMAIAGYDAMRDPATNSPAPWIVLGTAFKVFEAMLAAAPKRLPPSPGTGPD